MQATDEPTVATTDGMSLAQAEAVLAAAAIVEAAKKGGRFAGYQADGQLPPSRGGGAAEARPLQPPQHLAAALAPRASRLTHLECA